MKKMEQKINEIEINGKKRINSLIEVAAVNKEIDEFLAKLKLLSTELTKIITGLKDTTDIVIIEQ